MKNTLASFKLHWMTECLKILMGETQLAAERDKLTGTARGQINMLCLVTLYSCFFYLIFINMLTDPLIVMFITEWRSLLFGSTPHQ